MRVSSHCDRPVTVVLRLHLSRAMGEASMSSIPAQQSHVYSWLAGQKQTRMEVQDR